MSELIQTIKSRINCVDYANRNGLPIHKPGDRCRSPLRYEADNKTSFVVYNDFYYDFGSNSGGDVIDLAAFLHYNGDRGSAIRELAELTGSHSENYEDWKRATQNRCNLIQRWHEALRMQDYDYLHNRRITDETIKRLKIGFTGVGINVTKSDGTQISNYACNRIVIPYWKNGYVASWNARATAPDQNPKYLKPVNGEYSDRSAIFGLHTLERKSDFLVICEGAFDALSFEQENYPVLATMGGSFNKSNQLKIVRDICRQYKYVLLTFDNDNAGSSFTLNLAKYLFNHKIKFKISQIPHCYKDISEYYAASNDLTDLILSAQNGLHELCRHITDRDEFKTFAHTAARFVPKPELAELFSVAQQQGKFSNEWFIELRKDCFKAPSEDIIAHAVAKSHSIKYVDNIGFYEYSQGYWQLRTDTEISAYISEELGFYRTGSKIKSILSLLKSDTVTREEFNRKPIFNFINGTLNLDTLEFREHDSSDYSTMQVNYPYKPDVKTSEKFNQFIYEITDGDVKRQALLQEIAGYVLFTDCSLQTCAFLLGDGANGKSVYIDVLSSLFDPSAISTIELSGLINDFQRVQLNHSILNVSEETSTDVKGAETIFKQVVAGGQISACYKHQDFITFRPRTKFIFACNEIPHVKDLTYGMERRMCFVKFVNKFTDYPDSNNPHEFKADRNLTATLLSERPAIFNWALEGYKALKQYKAFTETDDSDDLKQSFREAINPITVFMSENPLNDYFERNQTDRISNRLLYEHYVDWCNDAGHNPKSRTGFIREFKRLLPETQYQEYHLRSGERGFEKVPPIKSTNFYNINVAREELL